MTTPLAFISSSKHSITSVFCFLDLSSFPLPIEFTFHDHAYLGDDLLVRQQVVAQVEVRHVTHGLERRRHLHAIGQQLPQYLQ